MVRARMAWLGLVRQRISAKIFLGFFVLFATGIVSSAIAWRAIDGLGASLDRLLNVDQPLAFAAYEMEINAIGSGLGVLKFLQSPNPAFRGRFLEDQKEFLDFQSEFLRLAPTEDSAALADKANSVFERYAALGEKLISAREELARGARNLTVLLADLRGLRSTDRSQDRLSLLRSLAVLSTIENDIAALLLSPVKGEEELEEAPREASPVTRGEVLGRLGDDLRQAARSLSSKPSSAASAELREKITSLAAELDTYVHLRRWIETNTGIFISYRSHLDAVLDDEVQILTGKRVDQIRQEIESKVVSSESTILYLGLLSLLLLIVSAVALSRSIVSPINSLAAAARSAEEAEIENRQESVRADEIGSLARALSDMTKRLRLARDELESRVEERTAKLSAATRDLEEELATRKSLEQQLLHAQKMESLGTFAAGLAHDFNNMLGVTLGFLEMSLQDSEPDSALHRRLSKAIEASDRSKDLVAQLLSFGRESDPEKAQEALADLVGGFVPIVRAAIPSKIHFSLQIEPNTGDVFADRSQIEQVIMNLCANAYQAIGPGGGHIEISVRRLEMDAETAAHFAEIEPGHYGLLRVTDSGCGVPQENLSRIFDPFFTTKPVGKGSGLGLSVVYGIVRAHGGAVAVKSEEGVGTSFSIYLPLVGP